MPVKALWPKDAPVQVGTVSANSPPPLTLSVKLSVLPPGRVMVKGSPAPVA